MLDIGWTELLVVALVLIIVVGPKDLPRVLRTAGRWAAKARSLAREFQTSIDDMARETDLADMKRELNSISGSGIAKNIENQIDPSGTLARAAEDTGATAAGDSAAAPLATDGVPAPEDEETGAGVAGGTASGVPEPAEAPAAAGEVPMPKDQTAGGDVLGGTAASGVQETVEAPAPLPTPPEPAHEQPSRNPAEV